MRKGTKIFIKLISTILLLILVVPIFLSLLIDIGSVQNYLVKRAAQFVSEQIETTVSIERVDIGLFNRVRIEGFYVEDYQRDTLLYVGDLEAPILGLGLMGGGLRFGDVVLSDAKFHMRETPSGGSNIKELLDRIGKKEKKSGGKFKLQIERGSLRNIDVCIERRNHRFPEYGVDFSNICINDIDANINSFIIDGVDISTNIEKMSARESSGFVIEDLSGHFYMTSGSLGFNETSIVTAKSNIEMSHISLVANSWAEYSDFIANVFIDGSIQDSRISSDDIAYFSPSMRDWNVVLERIGIDFSGTVDSLSGELTSLRTGQATSLVADINMKGLPDITNTLFEFDIKELNSTVADIKVLANKIGKVDLPEKLVEVVGNTRSINISGQFKGLLSSFNMEADLNTDLGGAQCNLRVKPSAESQYNIKGKVVAENVELGKFLNMEDILGKISFEANVDGLVGGDSTDVNVASTLSQLDFNRYKYNSINLEGRLLNRRFNGAISSRDKALDFDFSGIIDFNDERPKYDFLMNLHKANLVKMNVNSRDSISVLSAIVRAEASGNSLDDLRGTIDVKDVVYDYNDKQIKSKHLTIHGDNYANNKLIELSSDFADATFRSKASYRDVIEYLKTSLSNYLPALHDNTSNINEDISTAAINDYSLFSLDIKDINPIVDAITSGLQVADGSQVKLLFNPADDNLSLQLTSDYIERGGMLATRLSLNVGNRVDSLTMYVSAEDFYMGGIHFPDLSIMGGAKHGNAVVTAGFVDTLMHSSAMVSIYAKTLGRDGAKGQLIDLKVLPSHYTKKDQRWQIFSEDIRIDTARVDIEQFVIMNKEQRLTINGVASRNINDSLALNLENFDISPISQIIERLGYNIEGITNGVAYMKSALNQGELSAHVAIDSLKVNGINAPSLLLESKWDFHQNRAGVVVLDRAKRDTLIRGYYAPAQFRYYADVSIDSLDVSLLNPVLKGVISDTKGFAHADLTLQGKGRNAELRGEIEVSDFETTVDFTNVKYKMSKATIDVKNNQLKLSKALMKDPEGNSGIFDMDLNLSHLSNISYEISVAPNNLLVMNTTPKDNDLFYGKVYASGIATISGDKSGVDMDITAISEGNSHFYMPLSGKSNISSADFVIFKESTNEKEVSYLDQKKNLFKRQQVSKSSSMGDINITLNLDVRPNLEFQLMIDPATGNVIRGRGAGVLNLNINPRTNTFDMFGDYVISDGVYLFSLENIINKRFIIEEGSTIQWAGSPLDALLNIDAVYKVKASLLPLLQGSTASGGDRSVPVDCYIYLRDRLTSPAVSFDVKVQSADSEIQTIVANELNTPETIDTQFLYLLVFNSFLADSENETSAGEYVSATGFEFLTNQLSNLLSADDYNIVLRYRPKSELTSEEVDFGLSKSLINDRLIVEFEGNYVVDNNQAVNEEDASPYGGFGGEAYVTWLIDRAGALKLKGFTQTIDRFDENQGLQETGIGIYFKEDFNNFADLRQRLKNRFINKKRRARREARALEREKEEEQKIYEYSTQSSYSNVNRAEN